MTRKCFSKPKVDDPEMFFKSERRNLWKTEGNTFQMEKLETTSTVDKNVVFAWKNFIFCAYFVRCEVVLKWKHISSTISSNEQEAKQPCSEPWSDDADPVLEVKSGDLPSKETDSVTSGVNTTSLSVDGLKQCEVLAAGLSFDEDSVQRVPVLLLRSRKDEKFGAFDEYIFVKVKEPSSTVNVGNVHYNCDQTSDLRRINNTPQEFTLVLTRSYLVKINGDLSKSSPIHPAFLSSLQLLLVNPRPNSLSLRLYTHDTFSSRNLIQDFGVAVNNNNLSDIQILDTFYLQEDRTLVAIVCFKTDEEHTKFQCLQFSQNGSISSSSSSEKYDLTQLPADVLFDPDFAEIVKAVAILSITRSLNLVSKSRSFCSSVIVVTVTGYALKFVDGALSCCVNLVDPGDELAQVNWSNAVVKVIHLEGCQDRAAVQVNTSCLLIDWTREKVVRSWHPVLTAVPCDVQLCGVLLLLLVFEPHGAPKAHALLEEADIRVINVDCDFDDEGSDTGEHILGPGMMKNSLKVSTTEDSLNQPLSAVHALLGQQKKCEEAVRELQSGLQGKLSFLTSTWQQLSNLHISEGVSQRTSSEEPPLTVMVEGSLPSRHCPDKKWGQDSIHRAQKQTELGAFWKRIVDSHLVVGVSVRNISQRDLASVALSLVPTSGGQAQIFQFTSKCGKPQGHEDLQTLIRLGTSDRGQKCTGGVNFGQDHLIPPGHSAVVTCTVDLSQCTSAADLRFQVSLDYSVKNDPKSASEVQKLNTVPARKAQEYCQDVILTSRDLLNETFSVRISTDVSASALASQDLWALDCLQDNLTLAVQSAVSSVTCLSPRLSGHPSVRYLPWADQFLLVTSHWLQLCRVQILEQSSRHRATIKVFFRSPSQAVLLVKFLYSCLPEDITLTSNPPSDLSAIMCTGQTILQDIDIKINTLKEQIDNMTAVAPPGEENLPQDESLSPKFHTKKAAAVKLEARQSASLGETSGRMGDRTQFRRAKKRFREIWGDDEDLPESG